MPVRGALLPDLSGIAETEVVTARLGEGLHRETQAQVEQQREGQGPLIEPEGMGSGFAGQDRIAGGEVGKPLHPPALVHGVRMRAFEDGADLGGGGVDTVAGKAAGTRRGTAGLECRGGGAHFVRLVEQGLGALPHRRSHQAAVHPDDLVIARPFYELERGLPVQGRYAVDVVRDGALGGMDGQDAGVTEGAGTVTVAFEGFGITERAEG